MELVNEISAAPEDPAARFAAETAVSLIQPYAPHVAEELWERSATSGCGRRRGRLPTSRMLVRETVRARRAGERQAARPPRRPDAGTPEDELVAARARSPKVQAHLNGAEPRKTIVVPDKLVSLVV